MFKMEIININQKPSDLTQRRGLYNMGPMWVGGVPISFWRQFKDDVCSSGNR